MYVENAVFVVAGIMVLAGTALGFWVSPWFLVLPAFAGFNMLQSAFTGICPAAMIFRKLGMKSCCTKAG